MSGLSTQEKNVSEIAKNIPLGEICIQEYIVDEQYTAKHIGSGRVEVLATPAMILFMENTALNCVQKYLPENYTTVGVSVNVKHLNPVPKSEKVIVEARIDRVEDRKIVFYEVVKWRGIIIGEGIHERYIVNIHKFIDKINKLLQTM